MGDRLEFPKNFVWGTATAGHQIEGHNSASDWWVFEHEGKIHDGTVSGRCMDYWNKYDEDHALMNKLGYPAFRLGIEWAKVEPRDGHFDPQAIERYRAILQSLKDRNIRICLTLYHWVLPLWFAAKGGWTNPAAADRFMKFVELIVDELGEYPEWWVTLNEPLVPALAGYLGGEFPPEKKSFKLYGEVTGRLLECHARAYQLIHRKAPPAPGGTRPLAGIAQAYQWIEPWGSDGLPGMAEKVAARVFRHGSFAGWDESVVSGRAQFPFGSREIPNLQNSYDFCGVNYYFRMSLKFDPSKTDMAMMDTATMPDGIEKTEMGWQIYPPGFHKILMETWNRFRKPIYITENGIADSADKVRPRYLLWHLRQLHRAIQDGADIRGYFHWSFMDNFEWKEGFCKQFGLVAVDHTDPALARRPRRSAELFSAIIAENAITEDLVREYAPEALDGVFGDQWME